MFKSLWDYVVHLFWKDEKKIVTAVSKELPVLVAQAKAEAATIVATVEKVATSPQTAAFAASVSKAVSDGVAAIVAEVEKLSAGSKK